MNMNRQSGFTLIELIVVISLIALIASFAVPNFFTSKGAANQTAAIASLRGLSSAQTQLASARLIDTDHDGNGEFGFLGELSGHNAIRGSSTNLRPPAMSSSFGLLANSRVVRQGYLFQIYLPDAAGVGVAEDPSGGKANASAIDSNNAEMFWCAYAWPVKTGSTGTWAFFTNQSGEILRAKNTTAKYRGHATAPNFDAAFLTSGSMTGPVAINQTGQDGETWVYVR